MSQSSRQLPITGQQYCGGRASPRFIPQLREPALPSTCRSRAGNNRERDRSMQRLGTAQNAEPKGSKSFRLCDAGGDAIWPSADCQ